MSPKQKTITIITAAAAILLALIRKCRYVIVYATFRCVIINHNNLATHVNATEVVPSQSVFGTRFKSGSRCPCEKGAKVMWPLHEFCICSNNYRSAFLPPLNVSHCKFNVTKHGALKTSWKSTSSFKSPQHYSLCMPLARSLKWNSAKACN